MKHLFWFCLFVLIIVSCNISKTGLLSLECKKSSAAPIEIANLTKLDPEKATHEPDSKILWYDARELRIEGKGWTDTETFYERIPARAKSKVSKDVQTLSTHTAGIAVRFVTNAKKIQADWTVGGFDMKHMAATGIRGLDLYARQNGKWVFEGTGCPVDNHTIATIGTYMPEMSGEPTEFILYLPLYDKLLELKIGIPEDAFIAPAPKRSSEKAKPIVFYGTSITQGGCASRSGMCHTAILGRWLDREVINLGFSGAGKMEPEMADLLAELDPVLYVLEALPNMTPELVKERIEPTVQTLRKAHPETPILLVENPINAKTNPGNVELRKVYQRLKDQKIPEIYYLCGESQLAGKEDGTVDGVHPTDLGFYRMSKAYYPVMKKILNSVTTKNTKNTKILNH